MGTDTYSCRYCAAGALQCGDEHHYIPSADQALGGWDFAPQALLSPSRSYFPILGSAKTLTLSFILCLF